MPTRRAPPGGPPVRELVSEPDPRKSKRRVWHIGRGGSVHCGMLGILLIAEPCKVYRVFCWTRYQYKRSIFPACRLQLTKTKQNAKKVLVRLAFPINAHQNANQKLIGSAPSYRAQCTLPPQPMCQTCRHDRIHFVHRDSEVWHVLCALRNIMQRLSVVETQSQKGNVIFEVETGGLWLPVVHM